MMTKTTKAARYQIDHNNLSLFHNMVSYGAHVLYVEDLKLSTQFYWSIGFRDVFCDDMISVMRMKHIHIELWNNQKCNTLLPKNPIDKMNHNHKALHIEIGKLVDLHTIHNIFCLHNIPIEKTQWDFGSPFGAYILLKDPDGNRITFCTERTWSNQSGYEKGCRQFAEEKKSVLGVIKSTLDESLVAGKEKINSDMKNHINTQRENNQIDSTEKNRILSEIARHKDLEVYSDQINHLVDAGFDIDSLI
ncbi:hypothetical protein CXF85_08700 [Colwellia sp. 75C3]|uniref:hypothetical protein n=1 Tax=Colwellia sp. 75C3 TaxID=888425 RepID=UPI000C345FEF|nr:hypothetical protein [Colwellia sp. 75C3]PKG84390.1 hypothetical protein CXF85_08700 [Colwellia sp. 75C3]